MAGDPTLRAVIDSSGAAVGAARFNAACQSMVTSASTVSRGVLGIEAILGSLATAFSARAFIDAGDNFLSLKAKLALFAQEGVSANDILDGLVAAAQRANAPVIDLKNTFTRNASALNQLGYSTSEQIRLSETLYKALVIGGNATDAGRQAVEQFSQALNSGRLRGQDFNSVSENATEIIRILARETGKTTGEIRDLANKGMIPAKLAIDALLNGSKETDEQFKKIPQTVGQASSQFSSMFSLVIGESAEATGSNKALAGAIDEWMKTLSSPAFRGVIDFFSNGLKSIADYASDAAKEIKLLAIESDLAAQKQKEAAEQQQGSLGKWISAAGTIFKMGLGFWTDQAGAALSGTFGMTPQQQAAIRSQAELLSELKGSITDDKSGAVPQFNTSGAKRTLQFGGAETQEEIDKRVRLTAQLQKQIDLEGTNIQIKQAEIAGDTSQVQVLQTQLEIRQKISDDMRKASPEKAAALEQEITQEHALEIQLKAVQEVQSRNTQFATDFASTITDAFGSAIKGGQSFGQTLKQLTLDLIDVITKAAVLEPLGRSIGSSLSKALNGSTGIGGGSFDIGNLFGLGGGDAGLGSWAPTVTAFASGGIVNGRTPFAYDGGLGVAGEAGTEAILPLTRGPSGDLGVKAVGAGATVVNNWTLQVQGDATDATIARMQSTMEQLIAAHTPAIVDQSVSAVARQNRNNKNYLRR